jgi:hypothetical protein
MWLFHGLPKYLENIHLSAQPIPESLNRTREILLV